MLTGTRDDTWISLGRKGSGAALAGPPHATWFEEIYFSIHLFLNVPNNIFEDQCHRRMFWLQACLKFFWGCNMCI